MDQQLTLAFSSDSEAQNLYRHLLSMREAERESGIRMDCRGRRVLLGTRGRSDDQARRLVELSAAWIADYIVDHVEVRLLRGMTGKSVEAAPEEIEQMVACCRQMLNGTDCADVARPDRSRRSAVRKALRRCLSERPDLNLEGFLRFRLRDYLADLQGTAECAVNEYVSNRQYREFIELLRYFVHFQESRIAEVHLIHDGGSRFRMYDGRMQPLEVIDAKDVVMETVDRELNVEDMVVSALISASPRLIRLHTREPQTASVETIFQIFEDRVIMCHRCKICAPPQDGRSGETGVSLDR